VNPRLAARILGGGRAVFGVVMLIAPGRVAEPWIGESGAGVRTLMRTIGVRDVAMGMIALHTADHPQVGARWQMTCAGTDAVDALATLAAASELPMAGVVGTALLAGGSAVAGYLTSRALRRA
jgi:hypothetical protein